MKKFTVRPATRRTLRFACATVLAVAFGSTFPQQAYAQRETPPPRARYDSGARRPQALHGWSRLRYSELHLPAFGRRLRLDVVRSASHAVPQRRPADDDPLPQPQSRRGRHAARDVAALRRYERGVGKGNRHVLGCRLRCAGRDPMAPARSRGSGGRTDRRQKVDGGDPHSPAEHGGRDRSGNRMFAVGKCREPNLRPV